MAIQNKKLKTPNKCLSNDCNSQPKHYTYLNLAADEESICVPSRGVLNHYTKGISHEDSQSFDSEENIVSAIINYRIDIPAHIKEAHSVVILRENKVLRIFNNKRKKPTTIKTIAPKIKVKNKTYIVTDGLNYDE